MALLNPVESWTLDGKRAAWSNLFDISKVEAIGPVKRRLVLTRNPEVKGNGHDNTVYAFDVLVGNMSIPCCHEVLNEPLKTNEATEAFRAEIVSLWAEALRSKNPPCRHIVRDVLAGKMTRCRSCGIEEPLSSATMIGPGITEAAEQCRQEAAEKASFVETDATNDREVCPKCGTVHNGFTPNPGQMRSFWKCRRCNAHLITYCRGSDKRWFTKFAIDATSDEQGLSEIYELLRSWMTFLWHPLIAAISALTLSSDDMSAFRQGLMALHTKYEKSTSP